MSRPLVIYVDVDETLVRNVGAKQIPMPSVIQHIRDLYDQGAGLYCWSSGGASYAAETAETLAIAHCFQGFLPKPHVMIDDMALSEWRFFREVHPNACASQNVGSYTQELFGQGLER